MIAPKGTRPTAAQENNAYELATLRDDNTCVKCGKHGDINRDHRQNRLPGNTVVENLQCLCGTGVTGCHGWKTSNPKEAMETGFSVPSWADPAEWPARRRMATQNGTRVLAWCLYGSAGEVTSISEAEARARMDGTWR